MKAVISVTGKDGIGIVADVSKVCSEYGVNISDVSQTVMQEYFVMIMLVSLDRMEQTFADFSDALVKMGKEKALDIHVMHEDIFNAMHKI